MDHKGVAGPVPQIALHNALEKEQVRQNMSHRRSDEVLLDEEGIALDDLSHQISPVGPPALDRPPLNSQFQSANNTGQTGWRRHHGDPAGRRDSVDVLALGRLYQKLGKLSIIPRYFFYIAPLGIIIAIPLVIGAVIPSAELGGVRLLWLFLWVEIVWLSLWAAKIVAKILPFVFRQVVGFVSSGTAKYGIIIKALEVPLTLLGWMFTTFITFIPIMTLNPTQRSLDDTNVKDWEGILRQILAALTVTALIYVIQKTFIQFVAVNFHKVSYEQRIKDNKKAVHILARLYEQSRDLFPTFTNDFHNDDEILMSPRRHKKGNASGSGTATPTVRQVLGNAKKAVNKATSAFGSAAQEITGKQIFQPSSPYNVVVDALSTAQSSSSLARRLWFSVAAEGQEGIHKVDFEDVLGNPEEAHEAMVLFDKDGNGDVNLEEAEMVVNEISKERKSLARSMRDVDSAISKLDDVLVVVVFIVAIFVMISFLNTNFATTLATAGTALLSLSFIFAATCQEILASILFLFYKHPFDVGDRVDISGSRYVVKELSLLFTIFKRLDGTIVQVNNAILNSIWIENVRRSTSMSETIQLSVDFGTSFSMIQKLRREMLAFVSSNARDYTNDLEIEVVDAKGLDKLLLKIVLNHKGNWQNESLRKHRRNKFMCALIQAVRKVGIVGGGPGVGEAKNPMYVIKTIGELPSSDDSRPNTSSSHKEFVNNGAMGGKRRMAEDPATQVDDDRPSQQGFTYYAEEDLNKQLSGTTEEKERVSEERVMRDTDIDRGKSLGKRRKQVQDLEKGPQR